MFDFGCSAFQFTERVRLPFVLFVCRHEVSLVINLMYWVLAPVKRFRLVCSFLCVEKNVWNLFFLGLPRLRKQLQILGFLHLVALVLFKQL